MTVTARAGASHVALEGIISERVEFDTSKIPAGQPVVVDTAKVEHMNSLGVRNWIRFITALCAQAPSVTLEKLSPIMVFQASMISTFLGSARVNSYQTPWVCEDCDRLEIQTHSLQEDIPESVPCPKCKTSGMEFDSDPDSYQTFRYLATQQSG